MVDDPSALVEIEHPSGTRTRFTDFDQISDSEYRTDFIFSEAGTWRLVALPDLEDRSLLPADTTDVVVVVEAPLVGDTSDGATLGLYLFGALVLAIVGLVLYVTRHKLPWNHSPRTPSVPHDTWWNSP
jgi:hypothetical protein